MGANLLYIFFSTMMCLSATCVVFFRNPIHSLLCLIMTFFNAAGIFLIWQAEFAAMILIIVYVGAVSILFLFVVMTMNTDALGIKSKQIKTGYAGFSAIITLLLCVELIAVMLPWKSWDQLADLLSFHFVSNISNTHALGLILYTKYFYAFQGAGIILLISMIGIILLAYNLSNSSKTKVIPKPYQNNSLQLNDVGFKEGITL